MDRPDDPGDNAPEDSEAAWVTGRPADVEPSRPRVRTTSVAITDARGNTISNNRFV